MAQEVVRLTSNFPPERIQQRTISLEKESDPWVVQPPAGCIGSCSGVALRALVQAGAGFPGCGRLKRAHSCHCCLTWLDLCGLVSGLFLPFIWDELKVIESGTSLTPILNSSQWVVMACGWFSNTGLSYVGCKAVRSVSYRFAWVPYRTRRPTDAYVAINTCYSFFSTCYRAPIHSLSLGREGIVLPVRGFSDTLQRYPILAPNILL